MEQPANGARRPGTQSPPLLQVLLVLLILPGGCSVYSSDFQRTHFVDGVTQEERESFVVVEEAHWFRAWFECSLEHGEVALTLTSPDGATRWSVRRSAPCDADLRQELPLISGPWESRVELSEAKGWYSLKLKSKGW